MKSNSLFYIVLFIVIHYSCKKNICPEGFSGDDCAVEDVCLTQSLECLNGGECIDGFCECPDGFSGTSCEFAEISRVQEFLDSANYSPFDLYNAGVPLDSLYGKIYQGGLIFYLDTIVGNGLVAAMSDQSEGVVWGCQSEDMNGAEQTEIGQGAGNTFQIINDCEEEECAAKICNNLELNNYTDWFLPSIGGMQKMVKDLHMNGYGNFNGTRYWSSTEQSTPSTSTAWMAKFVFIGEFVGSGGDFKSNSFYIRAARQFEP